MCKSQASRICMLVIAVFGSVGLLATAANAGELAKRDRAADALAASTCTRPKACIAPVTIMRSAVLACFAPFRGMVQIPPEANRMTPRTRVITDPEILGGKPVIAGTRITVELILTRLGEGRSVAEYPHLSVAQVTAAIDCARAMAGQSVPAAAE